MSNYVFENETEKSNHYTGVSLLTIEWLALRMDFKLVVSFKAMKP